MENYLPEIFSAFLAIAGAVVTFAGFAVKNWAKFAAIYQSAENSYHVVEELALQEGWATQKKIEEFELKFKGFMKWSGWAVNEKTLSTAHDLAKAFCDKYRSEIDKYDKKQELNNVG